MTDPNPTKDAPGGNTTVQPQTPQPKPDSTATAPKMEFRDGAVFVDGKKHVPEHQLIAAKENLQKQIESAQSTHNEAVDKLRLDVSAAQTELATANAALTEAKKARTTGDISAEEMSRVKKEAEDAKAALNTAKNSNLDYRRKYIMATYHIAADSDAGKKLAEKTSDQLDSFEEALKALGGARPGPGNYATGGSGGGATAPSPMDRAKALLAATPIRGVHNSQAK